MLIVCDRPNWAYDTIAKALIKYSHDPFLDFDVAYLKGGDAPLETIHEDYSLVFAMGWQLLGELRRGRLAQLLSFANAKIVERFSFLDPKRTLTGIHSHRAWDNQQTQPDNNVLPSQNLIKFLRRYRGVNAVSQRLHELFRQSGLTNVVYTPNGVDIELFQPKAAINLDGPLRIGFSGNKKSKQHDQLKGISEFIEPACDLPGVELKLAMPQEGRYVTLQEMPRFYDEIDVYLCASSSEGFSLSVLEASACGRPVISTRVGGCEDLIIDGVNGFLVDRSVQAIRDKVEFFLANRDAAREMGAQNRKIVEEHWSWAKRAPAWIEFIKAHLPADEYRQQSSKPCGPDS